MKYIHTTEYSPLGRIPDIKDDEYEFQHLGNIFRVSIAEGESKRQIKEQFDPYYNNSKLEEKIIPLQNVVIVDDLDIQDRTQKLVYVFECPVCLNTIVSTDPKYDWCPQCENQTYDLNLIAIINQELMEDIAIDEADDSTVMFIKDGKLIKTIAPGEDD